MQNERAIDSVAEGSTGAQQFGRAQDLMGLSNVPEMFRQMFWACSADRPANADVYTFFAEYRTQLLLVQSLNFSGRRWPLCWSGLFARVTNAAIAPRLFRQPRLLNSEFGIGGLSELRISNFQTSHSAFQYSWPLLNRSASMFSNVCPMQNSGKRGLPPKPKRVHIADCSSYRCSSLGRVQLEPIHTPTALNQWSFEA